MTHLTLIPDLPGMTACHLHARPFVRFDSPPASPLHSYVLHRYRNFYLLSIAYAVCLGLGPDLPRADEPSSGNLSHSVDGILTRLALLTPALLLTYAPLTLSVASLCIYNARLPSVRIHSFGNMFCFGTFSAQRHSTSELLRTL